jgi:hypothetical protein
VVEEEMVEVGRVVVILDGKLARELKSPILSSLSKRVEAFRKLR